MKEAPDPEYSPDFAPSDVFLFGNVKRMFSSRTSHNAEELLSAIDRTLSDIENPTLIGVFRERVRRIGLYVETKGSIVHDISDGLRLHWL
jgi:hypothetical protein